VRSHYDGAATAGACTRRRATTPPRTIIDEQDRAVAVAKRFTNGQRTAKWEGTGAPVGPLS
jgi:hypothetical protein